MMAQVTWPVAQNHCRMMYTDVGTILSGTDWLRLKKEATRNGLATSAWVGLYNDINSWRWSLNGFPLKNVTYSNWKAGEPDNYAGKEACAIMAGYGTWDDASCTEAKPFICYSGESISLWLVLQHGLAIGLYMFIDHLYMKHRLNI